MGGLEPARRSIHRGSLGPPQLRVGDVERRRIIDELQRHYVLGRLDQEELDGRVSRSLAARTVADLESEVADLPFEPPSGGSASSATASTPPRGDGDPDQGTTHLGQSGHTELLWQTPDFRAHAIWYALTMVLLVAIWLVTTPGGYFWPIWPMLGWGFGLASHGFARKERMRHRARDRARRQGSRGGAQFDRS